MDGENIIALPICIICSSYILALDEVVQSSDRARYVHEVVQHLLAIHRCPALTSDEIIKHQHLGGHYRHIRCIYISCIKHRGSFITNNKVIRIIERVLVNFEATPITKIVRTNNISCIAGFEARSGFQYRSNVCTNNSKVTNSTFRVLEDPVRTSIEHSLQRFEMLGLGNAYRRSRIPRQSSVRSISECQIVQIIQNFCINFHLCYVTIDSIITLHVTM